MEIRDYLSILRKRGWIIIVLAVLAAGVAFGVSQVQTPIYKAKAMVSVVPARPDWGLGNTAKDLLRNFAVNIKTHKTASQVIDRAAARHVHLRSAEPRSRSTRWATNS